MRFVPFRAELAAREDVIAVGGGGYAGLNLSVWPGNRTPPSLRADTLAGIALNFLHAPDRERRRRGEELVTCEGFDGDGLLAIWALLYPERALELADVIIASAVCIAFQTWTTPEAAQFGCTVGTYADPVLSPIGDELLELDDENLPGRLYEALLPEVEAVLISPEQYAPLWRDEFDAIERGRETVAARGHVKAFPDVDLGVVRTPGWLHRVAAFSATEHDRVLIISETAAGPCYDLSYKTTSWVALESRRPAPRVDLAPLASELERLETSGGHWAFDGIREPHPSLSARYSGQPVPSSIPPEPLVEAVVHYLRNAQDDPALLWSPYEEPTTES